MKTAQDILSAISAMATDQHWRGCDVVVLISADHERLFTAGDVKLCAKNIVAVHFKPWPLMPPDRVIVLDNRKYDAAAWADAELAVFQCDRFAWQ